MSLDDIRLQSRMANSFGLACNVSGEQMCCDLQLAQACDINMLADEAVQVSEPFRMPRSLSKALFWSHARNVWRHHAASYRQQNSSQDPGQSTGAGRNAPNDPACVPDLVQAVSQQPVHLHGRLVSLKPRNG